MKSLPFLLLPVVIVAERKAVSLTLDKASVNLVANIVNDNDNANVIVTVKDQYGENMPAKAYTTVSSSKSEFATVGDGKVDDNGMFTVTAVAKGQTVVTATYENGTVKVERKLTVNVTDANELKGDVNGITADVSATRVDSIIKSDATGYTAIRVKAFGTVNGAKKSFLDINSLKEVTLTKGSVTYTINSTTGSAIATNSANVSGTVLSATSSGAIELKVNDLTTGWKLEAGHIL